MSGSDEDEFASEELYPAGVVAGAIVGVVVALVGAVRTRVEGRPEPFAILPGAIAGAIGGATLVSMRRVARRGSLGHYVAWGAAGLVGLGAITLPGFLIGERPLSRYLLVLAMGFGTGLGIGYYMRAWGDHKR